MKLAVFDDHRIGLVEGETLVDVTRLLPDALGAWPQQRVNWLIRHWDALRPEMPAAAPVGARHALTGVRLRAANPAPPQVFAAPVNFRPHIGELAARAVTRGGRSAREQGFFLKAPASVTGAGEGIELPHGSTRRFDHEAELAVVIGNGGRDIPRADAMRHVFGYACLVDVTMRIEPGTREEERSMRKSFRSFTPLGPWIVTSDELPDAGHADLRLYVNGELRQQANTADMIVDIAEMIELVSSVAVLSPGDVIAMGTPQGVGPFGPGDRLRIAIEGVGDMTLDVREAAEPAPRAF